MQHECCCAECNSECLPGEAASAKSESNATVMSFVLPIAVIGRFGQLIAVMAASLVNWNCKTEFFFGSVERHLYSGAAFARAFAVQ